MRVLVAIGAVAVAVAAAAPGVASAEPAAAPTAPRVFNVPTAHLQGSGRAFVTAGASVLKDRTPFFQAVLGLGNLADVDITFVDSFGTCRACLEGGEDATALAMPTAAFKLGLAEHQYARWQPAFALGLRAPLAARHIDLNGESAEVEVARLYAVASKGLGQLEMHAGVDAWDARLSYADREHVLHDQPVSAQVRPFAGAVWNPAIYPRTRLLLDFSWAPVVAADDVELRWLFGWGVRYQALSWASVELDVRHRGGNRLEDTEVMVRVNAAVPLLR